MNLIKYMKNFIIKTFYPRHIKCIGCKRELDEKNVYDMCNNCFKEISFIKHNYCTRCGLQMPKDGNGICLSCKRNNFSFEFARSVAMFSGNMINIIHKFKYAKYKFLADPLSYLLYDLLMVQDWKIDLITYTHLHPNREKSRGYNQSRELANHLSKLTNIPVLHDIIRTKDKDIKRITRFINKYLLFVFMDIVAVKMGKYSVKSQVYENNLLWYTNDTKT